MIIKREKIGQLSVWTDKNSRGKIIVTVYFRYQPIVLFDPDKINERRLAAVQLVRPLGRSASFTAIPCLNCFAPKGF